MATYLQGVQDAVQSIRPPDPQLQFDAQLLATRQSNYDQNHAKLSKMYGTILNSGLTREQNITAREEFFKLIESDLQKIAGMDLSKDSNVSKAKNVFKQIYTNDHLVKDMVWTKHYQSQLQRAEGFKNCRDPKECGGKYWEDGVKYMQYKREEFKNAGQDESLSFGNVDYIPNNNLLEDALEKFKELDPETKKVVHTPDGKYRITYTNGKVIEKPLQDFFGQLYANDPKFMDMYKVMAYNNRKDEIYASMSDGTYKDLNSATVGYIEKYRDQVQKDFDNRSEEITHDYNSLKNLTEAYQKDIDSGKIKTHNSKGEITEEYKLASQTAELFGKAEQLKSWNDKVKSAQKNLHHQSKREYITNYIDDLNSMSFFENEVKLASQTLADMTAQEEWEPDEYAMEDYQHMHKLQLQAREFAHKEEMERIKASTEDYEFRSNAFTAAGTFNDLTNEIEMLESQIYTNAAHALKDQLGNVEGFYKPDMTSEDWVNLKDAWKGDDGILEVELAKQREAIHTKKTQANALQLKVLDYNARYGPNNQIDLRVSGDDILYLDVIKAGDEWNSTLSEVQAQQLGAWYAKYKNNPNMKHFNNIATQLFEYGEKHPNSRTARAFAKATGAI